MIDQKVRNLVHYSAKELVRLNTELMATKAVLIATMATMGGTPEDADTAVARVRSRIAEEQERKCAEALRDFDRAADTAEADEKLDELLAKWTPPTGGKAN